MAKTRTYDRSFAGGVISPEMYGRIDDQKFQSGAAILKNVIATPTGAAENRPGFAYVNSTKNNGVARLIPFTFSLNQTMVIELGDSYVRFHTDGATLEYSTAGVHAWVAPSGAISLSYSTPTIVSWTAHGLSNGDPVRFYIFGAHSPSELPAGFKVGYTYTVQVIDANSFNILDNGVPVALPGGGGGPTTNYPGAGTATAGLSLGPDDSGAFDISPILGGLASVVVTDGIATLNVDIDSSFFFGGGSSGQASYQYSTGAGWNTFYSSSSNETTTVHVQIPIANLNTLQIRIYVTGSTDSFGSLNASATITSWSVDVPTGAGPAPLDFVRAYRYYTAGDMVSYGGDYFAALKADSGGSVTPGTDATIWSELPADLTYEIPSPYVEADLFEIEYAQSADVMTLVHPNYPPAELRRLGATQWALTPIAFGPPLPTATGVAVAASPGFLAQIASISTADPALFTTVSNHTLALGDGIYINNLTAVISGVDNVLDGFYMVQQVPADVDGNLIPNELTVMDYSGNQLDSSGWDSYHATDGAKPITIQYGSKIFNIDNQYSVQAIGADGVSTSAQSAAAHVVNNLNVPGSYNAVSWGAVAGAQSYFVFKLLNGLWGYIGQTNGTSFVDNNIAPDMSITPGIPDAVFATPGNYPGAVCYFEQRRCFAATANAPQNTWMSNSGTESMFSYSLPSRATDRIAFRVAALQADAIQHLVPMAQLILLTAATEFALVPVGTDAITPSSIAVKPQTYIGASHVRPTLVNTSMVYAAARGGHVRELGYAWTVSGYTTGDLSLRAAHLFDNLTIVDQAYGKSPRPIIWLVSSNGKLLGLTYIPEEQIGAWHVHETSGVFESVACVAEGSEDVLYAVIRRTINAQTVRYVERMASRIVDYADPSTWFFVDAGIKQTFMAPTKHISGLTWLEGETVTVLGDGGVQTTKVVTGGAITLDHEVTQVAIGLPYVSDIKTLPLVLQIDGFGQGITKNVNKVWLKVYRSSGVLVGPDANHLTPYKQRTTEPYGSPPALIATGSDDPDEIGPIVLTPSWSKGQVFIRQSDPLPLSIVGLTMEVEIGG